MDERLSRIRIVLVETTHPGNIGATARAMKSMGLSRLCLVEPARFPSAEATARAAGADDLLAAARISATLPEALSGCGLVLGTTARARTIPWPVQDPGGAAARVLEYAAAAEVALVFGRERIGLTNDEVELCHGLIRIPTDPRFSSLNIASAVQILAYEIYRQALTGQAAGDSPSDAPPATSEELERLYEHLERAMRHTGFYDPAKPRRLLRRVRRLFNRAALDRNEVQILRGFLASVEELEGPER